jgi:hypothetical protein
MVAWRTATWLLFNLGVQAIPVAYLCYQKGAQKPVWEYANCTLVVMIAVAMLFAAVSDLITERGKLDWLNVLFLLCIISLGMVLVHRHIYDEFVLGQELPAEVLWGALAGAAIIVWVGTVIKMKIWYDDAATDD